LAPIGSRDRFISLSDVSRIRLHPEDAISIKLRIDKLNNEGVLIFHKDRSDPAPQGSGLQDQTFVMCIQTGVLVKMTYLFTAMLSKPVPTLTAIAVNI